MTDSGSDNLRDELARVIGERVSWPSLHWGDFGHKDAHKAISDALVPVVERRVADAKAEAYEQATEELRDLKNTLALILLTCGPVRVPRTILDDYNPAAITFAREGHVDGSVTFAALAVGQERESNE